jgi:hypothetical protein
MAARPFLRPAIDQNKELVLSQLGIEIAKAVTEQHTVEAGRAAGEAELRD